MSDDESADPFRDEKGGPWHYSLRQEEILFEGLAEQPNVTPAIIALKRWAKRRAGASFADGPVFRCSWPFGLGRGKSSGG
jgi:hypothetical protein